MRVAAIFLMVAIFGSVIACRCLCSDVMTNETCKGVAVWALMGLNYFLHKNGYVEMHEPGIFS